VKNIAKKLTLILIVACSYGPCLANISKILPAGEYHYPSKHFKQIDKELRPNCQDISYADNYYIGLDFLSFKKQVHTFHKLTANYTSRSNKESFDCDNIAFLYKTLVASTTLIAKTNYEPLIGVAFVRQENKAMGLSSIGFVHAVNIIYTSEGWYMLEPQTGLFMSLQKYPNKILKLIF
tara:strand:- start:1909 stop:2445 length:537 start_codon:yes stop_codon:yes gene_type:complete